MHTQPTTEAEADVSRRLGRAQMRKFLRDAALQSALRKRAAGVPTYSVPEAAALLSISQEYLYRLIQADSFPAIRMRKDGTQGRTVVAAKVVELILDYTATAGTCVDIGEVAANWQSIAAGGAA